MCTCLLDYVEHAVPVCVVWHQNCVQTMVIGKDAVRRTQDKIGLLLHMLCVCVCVYTCITFVGVCDVPLV